MRVFKSARIKLTALYLVIIMFISVSFSLSVYEILSREVERFARNQRFRMEDEIYPPRMNRPPLAVPDLDLVSETKVRIALTLALINGGILVLSGVSGYFLAGYTLKPIAQMVEEQNRFISDASHEFKTPLTALKSSFEVFLRKPNSNIDQAKNLIKDGIKDVDSLNTLATSLLELAQFEKPNHISDFESVELDSVVGKAIDVIKPLAQKNRIGINSQESHLKVFGDKDRLTQLFTILLDNAVKYSPAGKSVDIATTHLDNKIAQVKVIDQGIGISSKDLPHVFDRFYRADASRSQANVSGYGLGLAIAKEIVKEHGGTVSVQSELGKGTTLQLKFRIDG